MMENIPWSITETEISLARRCVEMALEEGASDVRVSLSKSLMDLVLVRDGSPDKVSRAGDRSLTFNIFADGRYGTFSVNRLDGDLMRSFLHDAVETVRMLAPDEFRRLPDSSRTAKNALTGLELGLYDPSYASLSPSERLETACGASIFATAKPEGCRLISEEIEYSNSIYDNLVIDSRGLEARHIESSFEIGCETTIADARGNKYSGYWWDASPMRADLSTSDVCAKALQRAMAQINPLPHPGGACTMVVENEAAARLLSPVLGALSAFSVQQGNSFLRDSLGKKVFADGFTLCDRPHEKGCSGSKLFDSEGVATSEAPIIEGGTVREFFINTYLSGKLGMPPTREDAMRPTVLPFRPGGAKEGSFGTDEILALCGEGILVTGFNGGNHNAATGDFSYGVEGFAFKGGRIVHPIRGMVITGNMLTLWNNLIAAGDNPRRGAGKQVPTLAFSQVEFSA